MTATKYYIGTSGFSYPHWRGLFYPDKLPQARWLEHYAQTFTTVELNSTFYRLASETTVKNWRDRTPQDFLFAVKASRLITHLHRLHGVQEPLESFLSRMQSLEQKLGPVLYQLPPSLKRDEALLEAFLQLLPTGQQHVLEFRDSSWYQEKVETLLGEHNVALCVHDMSGSESPVSATADFAYFRFHGAGTRYSGDYTSGQLEEWARRIKELASENGLKAVYAYFNNDIGGYAVNNAQTLAQLLR